MHYLIYGKHKNSKRYTAMDISSGSFVANLIFATMLSDLDSGKAHVDNLSTDNADYSFQLRTANGKKVVYTGPENKKGCEPAA